MRARQVQDATARSINARAAAGVTGHYDVIVVSPPWPKVKPWPMSKFESLTVPEIQAILRSAFSNHASDACHIFIWAPQRFLPMVFDLLHDAPDEIKIQYVCTFVWVRGSDEQPWTLPRWNCEFCVYARKGVPKFLDLKGLKTCFEARRDPALEKPREFYQTIRRVTAGRRLHMFAAAEIEGFESWGDSRKLTGARGKYPAFDRTHRRGLEARG
jgi:N6-adenosine-specific RNA methylase IME4